jgi:hypothetical protein
MHARRFPPPWTAEVTPNCFIVRDHNGQALAYVYFENEPGQALRGQAAPARAPVTRRMFAILHFTVVKKPQRGHTLCPVGAVCR